MSGTFLRKVPDTPYSIIILFGRLLRAEKSSSRQALWYQHDCPVISMPEDTAGKYYSFSGMKEAKIRGDQAPEER